MGDIKINDSNFGFLERETDSLSIPEINPVPLSHSQNHTWVHLFRSKEASAKEAIIKFKNVLRVLLLITNGINLPGK